MKMTKTAVVALAKTAAAKNGNVQAQTEAQIEASDYQDRIKMARALAEDAINANDLLRAAFAPVAAAPLRIAYFDAFVDEATAIWGRKAQAFDRKRRDFARLRSGQTAAQAIAKARALVDAMRIRGIKATDGRGDYLRVEVERGWAVGASFNVGLTTNFDSRVYNPDDATQSAGTYDVDVQVSWSSTNRSVADAMASVACYREVVEAAAEVEGMLRRERIVWTYGVPEPVVEEAVANA